jgi:peptidoglycan/xylan/chitin deacetylase (PgdA/CDA1 family)
MDVRFGSPLYTALLGCVLSACTPAVTAAPTPAAPPPIAPAALAPPPDAAPPPVMETETPPVAPEPPPFAAAPAFEAAPRDRVRAVVLLYHLFGGMETELAVEPAAFEQQMAWLVEHHVPVISTSALMEFLEGSRELPERVAVIQIDDGHVSTRAKAYPVLARHQLRFTLALNTEAIEGHRPEAMTWDVVREMLSSGLCEIASHSHIHGHMDRLTDERNQSEATLSRSIIESRTGVRPEAFVFPFGGNTERVRRTIADAGYRAAFGVTGGAARAGSPRFHVPRVSVLRSTSLSSFARLFGEIGAEARTATKKGARKS